MRRFWFFTIIGFLWTAAQGVAAAQPASMPARRKPSIKNTLLNTVQALRAANRSRVKSGYGVAIEKTVSTQVGDVRNPPRRVAFWFSGNECLWKTYNLGMPHKLKLSILVKDGIRVRYFVGRRTLKTHAVGPFTPMVDVRSVERPDRVISLRPHIWTYRYITMISNMWSDNLFFTVWARKKYAAVTKTGPRIKVAINYPPQPKYGFLGGDDRVVFDVTMGGMESRYSEITHDRAIMEKYTNVTRWRHAADFYLPTDRVLEWHGWLHGKYVGSKRTSIRFLKFVVAPVKKSVFRVTNLGIRKGTIVFDNVHRERYYYSPAAAAWMLGREKPSISNHTPGGN